MNRECYRLDYEGALYGHGLNELQLYILSPGPKWSRLRHKYQKHL